MLTPAPAGAAINLLTDRADKAVKTQFVGLISGLACLALGSAAAAAPLLATNVAGIYTYPIPPAGFDAHHASAAALAAYGYPPRPETREGSAARSRWEAVVRATRIPPVLQATTLVQGPMRQAFPPPGAHGRNGTQYSGNWSGEVLQNNANGFGPGAFTSLAAIYDVPVASQAFGACTGGWVYSSTWAGIDGIGSSDVFQAGTESDAYCAGSNVQQYYTAWVEWYPASEVRITSLPVSPGDAVLVWMIADSATSGRAIVLNETTNQLVITSLTAPAGTSLKGNTAEWILERPTLNNNVTATLANYVQAWLSDENAVVQGNPQGGNFGAPPLGSTAYLLTMLDNNNQPISYVTPAGGAAAVYKDEGSAK